MVAPKNSFPPPKSAPPAQNNSVSGGVQFGTLSSMPKRGHAVVLYGPGGIGKTTLASYAPGPVAIIDFDNSLSVLYPALEQAGTAKNVRPIMGVETWERLLEVLNSPGWDGIKTIAIDSVTKAEELCIAWVIKNIKHEKGAQIKSIEDYGWGKGFTHVYETFLKLLTALDSHCRAGRNVMLVCHDCTNNVPNPAGDDWIRFEPRLQAPNSGKASVRLRVRDWADHMLFYGYDVVTKDGKGKGCGSRTIYPTELPHCMAKSRTAPYPIPIDPNSIAEFWKQIISN